MLLGEVIETVSSLGTEEHFPHFVGEITVRCLDVLTHPLHFMYEKVNRFLNKSPLWNVSRLPSYWIDKVFLHPPVDDDAHHREVDWLLGSLFDGLRSPSVSSITENFCDKLS